MVGELQREEAEVCMILAPTYDRLKVIDYLRLEPADTMVIVSLKPALLPAHLSFLRPFSRSSVVSLYWVSVQGSKICWTSVFFR